MNVGQWYVLIEEQAGFGSGIRWNLEKAIPASDLENAAEVAHDAALNHVPKNPMSPQSRAVFRAPDGSWVVDVKGATMRFHFRVSAGEYFGVFPGKPSA
jgi:hypothetical protein